MTPALFLILLLVLVPLAHVLYAGWVRRRFPLTGDVIVSDGVRLHFTKCGTGPAVVLVHGANGTWNDFPSEMIADLARDHTVFALDRPGHGWSDAPEGPLGLHENAAALLTVLRMHGGGAATLVGHSYGAAVALRAALEAPRLVSHVIGLTPCTAIDRRNARYADVPFVAEPAGLVLFHFLSLPLIAFGLLARSQAWYPERAPRGWSASRSFAYVPSQMHAAARNFKALRADLAWIEAHLPFLSARVTIVAGAEDRITPPARHVEWLRHALPAAHIEILPHLGHWLHRHRPDAVAQALRQRESERLVDPARP